jgi:predicted phosphoadenosine phosphosulfate sulfurtransferase
MMKREYLNENVYEALQRRLKFLFEEFDNIFVSFSGGKDSGLLLNLVLDFQKAHYPDKRIGVFHQDFEAQYSATTEYVERTFTRIEKDVEPYWVCLPMATRTALSSYEMYWYPWDNTKEDAWVRPMPQHEYVINIKNNPMTTIVTVCIRKTWPNNSAGGTVSRMATKKQYACWVFALMNRCSVTAVF